jgi:hypothetical protein
MLLDTGNTVLDILPTSNTVLPEYNKKREKHPFFVADSPHCNGGNILILMYEKCNLWYQSKRRWLLRPY